MQECCGNCEFFNIDEDSFSYIEYCELTNYAVSRHMKICAKYKSIIL